MNHTHRVGRFIALASSMLTFVLVTAPSSSAEDVNVIQWEQIIGLSSPGSAVGGVQPITFPWTAHDERSWFNSTQVM